MKLGKNSIQGIFLYNPVSGVIPEKGDFVVHNKKIWVVQKDSPSGAPGDNPGEYKLYMSQDKVTEEDIQYILKENPSQWPEKVISADMIPSILDLVYHGLSGQGIIGNTRFSVQDIINDQEHPHGVYALSRNLLGGMVDTDLEGPVFIKKQTYKEPTGALHVLLELMDYSDGSLWFMDASQGTSWKVVSPSPELKKIINRIVGQYRSRIADLDLTTGILKDNFRYTRLRFPESHRYTIKVIPGSRIFTGSNTALPVLPEGFDYDYTVVVLVEDPGKSVYYSESVTFPGGTDMNLVVPFKDFEVELTVTNTSNELSVSVSKSPANLNVKICSIYFQDFYGRQ